MSKKKREPINLEDYAYRKYRVDENYKVYSLNGNEKHLGTLVGFVTDDGFHGLYKNSVLADDLKIGTVKVGGLEIKVCKEPGTFGKKKLKYNAMVIRRSKNLLMAERPLYTMAEMPIYIIGVRRI